MADEHAPGGTGIFSRSEVEAVRGDEHVGSGVRIGVAVARFNSRITEALFQGAVDVITAAGVPANHVTAVQVPGVVELPFAARELVEADCSAIITLGCVIRGETTHYDYVCKSVTEGVLRVTLDHRVPVGFGVITAENLDQALRRSELGGGHNVGADAAKAALEMLTLARHIRD
jgi:6,7-dimethyl-8-ribityllumazine synthase